MIRVKFYAFFSLVVITEFYKEGKYDLDFKNPNSDPTKWVSIPSQRNRKIYWYNYFYCKTGHFNVTQSDCIILHFIWQLRNDSQVLRKL